MSCVLLWCSDVRLYETLDKAIESAMWTADSDNDWVDRIEVIDDNGESQIIEGEAMWSLIFEYEHRMSAALPKPPPHVANVFIDDRVLESFYGGEGLTKAAAFVEKWRPVLGDRISMRAIKGYRCIS